MGNSTSITSYLYRDEVMRCPEVGDEVLGSLVKGQEPKERRETGMRKKLQMGGVGAQAGAKYLKDLNASAARRAGCSERNADKSLGVS